MPRVRLGRRAIFKNNTFSIKKKKEEEKKLRRLVIRRFSYSMTTSSWKVAIHYSDFSFRSRYWVQGQGWAPARIKHSRTNDNPVYITKHTFNHSLAIGGYSALSSTFFFTIVIIIFLFETSSQEKKKKKTQKNTKKKTLPYLPNEDA